MKWDRVAMCDTWGAGAKHSLSTPSGEQPEFWLRPRYIRDAKGKPHLVNYAVDFLPGFLADGWIGAVFTPMGNKPVKGISNLPSWDDSLQKHYRDAIHKADDSLADSRTERLESIIPYVDENGKLGYNAVRLFYVPKVRPGPTKHLIIIKTVTFKLSDGCVQARQDGTGHGPPS